MTWDTTRQSSQGLRAAVFALLAALLLVACGFNARFAYADEAHSHVAGANEMASSKALLLEGMQPITGDQVKDGVYDIDAESSSPFFKAYKATLL